MAMPAAAADLILKRFRATLDTVYSDRIERVVLFGSRARGEAREPLRFSISQRFRRVFFLRGSRHLRAKSDAKQVIDITRIIWYKLRYPIDFACFFVFWIRLPLSGPARRDLIRGELCDKVPVRTRRSRAY
jgi:hypothetical protein